MMHQYQHDQVHIVKLFQRQHATAAAASSNSLTDDRELPTEALTHAHNFNSVSKFLQSGRNPAPNFILMAEKVIEGKMQNDDVIFLPSLSLFSSFQYVS